MTSRFHKLILICSFAVWTVDPAEESVASSDTPGESAHEEDPDEDEDEAEAEVDTLDSSENTKRKRSPTDSPGSTHRPKRPPVSNRDADDTWSKVVQVLFAGNHSV